MDIKAKSVIIKDVGHKEIDLIEVSSWVKYAYNIIFTDGKINYVFPMNEVLIEGQ